MSDISPFRGYRGIEEVAQRAATLADWMKSFRPESKTLTFRRTDLDLVRRWPKAAALHGFSVSEGRVSWNGFACQHNKEPPRYEGGLKQPRKQAVRK